MTKTQISTLLLIQAELETWLREWYRQPLGVDPQLDCAVVSIANLLDRTLAVLTETERGATHAE